MKISLIGRGRMAQAVERLAPEKGHRVVRLLGRRDNPPGRPFSGDWLEQSEVLVDFSLAEAVPGNIEKSLQAGIPLVIGATGWYDRLREMEDKVEEAGGIVLYASNFSLGVQVLFSLTRRAARLLSRFQEYDPFLWEAHHRHKLDAPSGTALSLREIVEESYRRKLDVASLRAGSIPGTHVVGFDSPSDTLRLEHSARNRDGFALGSLLAAQWLRDQHKAGRKGLFTMQNVIEEQME
ncbi:MAG TPA: 4-hydroxy-tetrahydrodipicolinate reductase [Acidobacteriota bacterium]|nr:4-hydroxy-tetrahydrodipicolinate reductase [Acidobacteriota bacterium]